MEILCFLWEVSVRYPLLSEWETCHELSEFVLGDRHYHSSTQFILKTLRDHSTKKVRTVDTASLHFPLFHLDLVEKYLQEASALSAVQPATIQMVTDIEILIPSVFPDLGSQYRDELWLLQNEIQTTSSKT